jgi:hypothetical protein
MSPTRSSSATAQAELEAPLSLVAGIDGRRAAADVDAAFVDCVVARRQGHLVAVACARTRPGATAGAALRARLN